MVNIVSVIIYFLFYLLWIKLYGYIITPLLFWLPFSFRVKDYIRTKNYPQALLITIIPAYFSYFISVLNTYPNYLEWFFLTFITFFILLGINLIFLYLLGFIDYLLNFWHLEGLLTDTLFLIIYLSFITLIYFTSNPIITWLVKII